MYLLSLIDLILSLYFVLHCLLASFSDQLALGPASSAWLTRRRLAVVNLTRNFPFKRSFRFILIQGHQNFCLPLLSWLTVSFYDFSVLGSKSST